MKLFTSAQKHRGFTLIELIVVIAILATLMGISYPAIMGFQENARISSASKACMDIVSGVASFKQDHNGILPFYPNQAKPNRDDQIYLTTEAGKDAGLVSILTGYEDGDEKLNINNEAYMKPTKSEEPRDGLYGDNAQELSMFDPWGKPYYIVLCEMDDGCIDPFTNKRIRKENCLVYSLGPDSEGVADAHQAKKRSTKSRSAGAKTTGGTKQSKAEAKLAAQRAKEDAEDAIIDNIFSWKKTVKK